MRDDVLRVVCVEDVQEAVRTRARLRVRGGGSKPAWSSPRDGETCLDVAALRGMHDYDPQELTFTAAAGTPLREVQAVLAAQGQCLPFDPLYVDAGATLGGTVASGLAGPAGFAHGGVRDFLIGMRCVDGRGRLIRGGGRVVKNAAGFDLPKLWVGSLGCLGVLVEVTFKVFPRPAASATWRLGCSDVFEAVERLQALPRAPVTLDALELETPSTLWCRLAGSVASLEGRCQVLGKILGGNARRLSDADAEAHWASRREPGQVPGTSLDQVPGTSDTTLGHGQVPGTSKEWVPGTSKECWRLKIPLTPSRILPLETRLTELSVPTRRVYGCGGQVLWLTLEDPSAEALRAVRAVLVDAGLDGLVFDAPSGRVGTLWLPEASSTFFRRVRQVFDAHDKFASLETNL